MSSHIETSHEEHVVHGGPLIYTINLVALLILTGITVGASFVDFGSANVVIALAIATMKATLVALFFMHLRWEKPINAVAIVAGFLFLGIFLMFDLIDIDHRRDPTPRNLPVMTEKEAPTPVPGSMNPLLTPAPEALPAPPAVVEGAKEGEGKAKGKE
ncbi:MAG: cytochrome C oxidase subunit IV family protein [Acidobacteriota bacterium]